MANVELGQLLSFHPAIEAYLKSIDLLHLLQDPSRIINADEACWMLDSRPGKVLVGNTDRGYDIQHAGTKQNCTVMLCHLADGRYINPMLVLSGSWCFCTGVNQISVFVDTKWIYDKRVISVLVEKCFSARNDKFRCKTSLDPILGWALFAQ